MAPSYVAIVTSRVVPPAVTSTAVRSPPSPVRTTLPSVVVTSVKVTFPPPVWAKLMPPEAVRFLRKSTVTASLLTFRRSMFSRPADVSAEIV